MPKDLLGGVWIAVASLQFGILVILGKTLADDGFPVVSVLVFRFGIAAILLAAGIALARRTLLPAPGEGAKLVALGAFGYGIEAAFFFLAIERGTATAVTLLFFVYPVFVMLASAALGRGMPGWLVGGSLVAALAGSGLVIVSSGAVDITPAGIAFALGSAVMFTIYLLGAEHTLQRTSSIVGAMWVSGAASLGLLIGSTATGSLEAPRGDHVWLVIGMGCASAGAFFCLFAGLRLLGAVRAAVVAAMEPLATAVLATIFLDEPVRAGTLAGGALILAGATAASVARARGPETETGLP